jgi:lanosterol synthase
MSLIYAGYPERKPIERAVKLIISRQLPVSTCDVFCGIIDSQTYCGRQDGSWAAEAMEGIFNKSCTITYPNFKFSFVIWALGKAHKHLQYLESRE